MMRSRIYFLIAFFIVLMMGSCKGSSTGGASEGILSVPPSQPSVISSGDVVLSETPAEVTTPNILPSPAVSPTVPATSIDSLAPSLPTRESSSPQSTCSIKPTPAQPSPSVFTQTPTPLPSESKVLWGYGADREWVDENIVYKLLLDNWELFINVKDKYINQDFEVFIQNTGEIEVYHDSITITKEDKDLFMELYDTCHVFPYIVAI